MLRPLPEREHVGPGFGFGQRLGVLDERPGPNLGVAPHERLHSARGISVDERYVSQAKIKGIEVTPVLAERAPRFVYVVGEVRTPGRFVLEGPTTLMQAIALAGGWNVGAHLRQVVVFRRGDDWRLMGTMLDIRGPLYGGTTSPADEIWLNDSDIVVVPKHPILVVDEFIELVFTRGIYGVLPNQGISLSFSKASTL